MASQSERLEQQSRQLRAHISETVEALRDRMTTGQMVEQLADYARHGPVAEFLCNLGREVRDNPLPLMLIVTGVAWLITASSLSPRARREVSAIVRKSGEADCNERTEDNEIAIASAPRDEGVDWAEPRLPGMPVMERAHEE